jgi:hypothetical protein
VRTLEGKDQEAGVGNAGEIEKGQAQKEKEVVAARISWCSHSIEAISTLRPKKAEMLLSFCRFR